MVRRLDAELPIWWRPSIPNGEINLPSFLRGCLTLLELRYGAKCFGKSEKRRLRTSI